jgi:hypothetical protein
MQRDAAMAQQQQQQRMAIEKAQREDQAAQAGILNIQDQVRSRRESDALNRDKFKDEQNNPKLISVAPGGRLYNPKTSKEAFTAPERPKPLTATDIDRNAEQWLMDRTGHTIESQSQESLAGRLEAIKGRLTPAERRLLDAPTDADDPQSTARAQSKWAKIQDDELNSIRRDTAARVRAEYRQSQSGGTRGAQNATSPGLPKGNPKAAAKNQKTANLKDLTSLWK